MTRLIISPLARIAEMAVRHKAREMISLMAKEQSFHRPAVINPQRHLLLAMNDISFKGTGNLIAPDELHVQRIFDFGKEWDRSCPLLIHCWMGVSRSPAAAIALAAFLFPDLAEEEIAVRLRAASPFATPNSRIIEIADSLLGRQGRLVRAVQGIGRGKEADGNAPFVFDLTSKNRLREVDGMLDRPTLD
ncbi:tyrosine phosphatase family protein [Oryzifoliimicrobium ureilyticus]|uniref:tyrosine phosphatase family protein n=1 Tax=Oryzifoliimicrobium ureilyticus TaxID=3113724 RepID=UPI0030764841